MTNRYAVWVFIVKALPTAFLVGSPFLCSQIIQKPWCLDRKSYSIWHAHREWLLCRTIEKLISYLHYVCCARRISFLHLVSAFSKLSMNKKVGFRMNKWIKERERDLGKHLNLNVFLSYLLKYPIINQLFVCNEVSFGRKYDCFFMWFYNFKKLKSTFLHQNMQKRQTKNMKYHKSCAKEEHYLFCSSTISFERVDIVWATYLIATARIVIIIIIIVVICKWLLAHRRAFPKPCNISWFCS